MSEVLLEVTMRVMRNGDIHEDTATHGNSFSDVYRGFHLIKAEVERQIAARRECPYNPKYGHLRPEWMD